MLENFSLSSYPQSGEEIEEKVKRIQISEPNKQVLKQVVETLYDDGGAVRKMQDTDAPTFARIRKMELEKAIKEALPKILIDPSTEEKRLALYLAHHAFSEGHRCQGKYRTQILAKMMKYLK